MCQRLCGHSTWGTSRQIPTAETRPRTVYFVSSHNKWQATPQSALSSGQLLQRNTYSSSPSRSTPVPPTSYCSLEPNLGASTPTTGEQTPPLTGMWQPQSKEEALFNTQCSCSHCNINHTPCQENNSQHTLRKAVEGIHTINSPHVKNIRLMQATREGPT